MHPRATPLVGSASHQRLTGAQARGGPAAALATSLAQQQQQQQQPKSLAPSASTPGFRPANDATTRRVRPASANQAARVHFNGAAAAASSVGASGQTTPARKIGACGSARSLAPLSHEPLSPMSPAGLASDDEERDDTNTVGDFCPRLLASSRSEINIADGLTLLRDNLTRLLPNQMLRSTKYRLQVEKLIEDLKVNATNVYAAGVAKSDLLARAIEERTQAEASEQQFRKSITNLGLDRWGHTTELERDIKDLEHEIVERGRFSVEDQTSLGVGRQFGIEHVETKAEAQARAKNKTRPPSARTDSLRDMSATEEADQPQATSKLVYLKFRRLEQLIYVLKRKLSIIENYPNQRLIDQKYGNIDGLLARCDQLEAENMRLETRLTGGAYLTYREDALLKARNLNHCSPAFLHLLIVSLQQTLQSYMRAMDESVGMGRDFGNTKHPLNGLVKTWTAEVEREAHKLAGEKKRSTLQREAAAAASAGGAMTMLNFEVPLSEKIDIDDLYANMVTAKKQAEEKKDASSSSTGRLRASSAAQREAASSELASALTAASLEITSLRLENDLLTRELRAHGWMDEVRENVEPTPINNEHAQSTSTTTQHDEPEEKEAAAAVVVTGVDETTFTLPSDIDCTSPSADASEAPDVPPTVVRGLALPSSSTSASVAASPVLAPSGSSSGRLAPSVSRTLLAHLQTYASELSRYRQFVRHYQRLHVSREQALQTAVADKTRTQAVLLAMLRKHPQLQDAATSATTNGSAAGTPLLTKRGLTDPQTFGAQSNRSSRRNSFDPSRP